MSHRFRKIATVLLATAVTLQSTTFAAITREPEFSDLSEHWSKSIMMRLNGYGVICGYDDGTIRPDSYVSVTEFLTMMVKSLGFETEPGDGYWATPYIQKAVELGLIEPDEYSDYDATLTRSQAAKIIANALSDTAIADENAVKAKIYDYAEIAEEYKPYVLIAYDKKIVNGNHDNCFEPNRNITRAEASVIAVRLIDKNGGIKKPDNGNGPNNNSGDVTSSAKLYVAPNGSDNNDGSESSPFATVQKAKETIRNMNAANSLPEGGVTVYLRGGTYYIDEGMTFTKEDSAFLDYLASNNVLFVLRSQVLKSTCGYIHIIHDVMEKEDYECLFLKSDVIFLPYPRSFQYRTSGVLLEALSNHKKALVSDTSYFRQYQNVGIDIRYFTSNSDVLSSLQTLLSLSSSEVSQSVNDLLALMPDYKFLLNKHDV